jgi:hypothetical protein
LWTFTVATPGIDLSNVDLTGFKVEARDGSIGKVDEATHEAGGFLAVHVLSYMPMKRWMICRSLADGGGNVSALGSG